jgi:hypothetical protein
MDMYLKLPNLIIHNIGKNFISKKFRQYAAFLRIVTKSILVKTYWLIGIVERAYLELKRAYNIISEKLKGERVMKHIILQIAIKAINNTAGPDSLIPILLIFRVYP